VVSTPLKNISQLGLFPIYGKIKHVPNHQPANHETGKLTPPKTRENQPLEKEGVKEEVDTTW